MAVTNASLANIPFWSQLPMMYTNYGGDTQISTIPSYAGYNLGLSFNPIAQQTWGFPGGFNSSQVLPNAGVDQGAVLRQAQSLLAPALNQLTSQNLNTCINNIAATKARLNAKLQAEGTTAEEKAKIQEALEKLKECEDKLNQLKNSQDLDPQTAYQKVSELEAEVSKVVRDSISTANGGSTPAATVADETSKPEKTSKTEPKQGAEDADEAEETDSADSAKKDEASGEGVDNFTPEIKAEIDKYYDAIDGIGTDDASFESVLNNINEDNVMDYVLGWNKYHSAEKGESFMEAFMWDADPSQKKKYGKQIARALRDKAEKLGVYDQCKKDFAKIDKEMGSWLWVNNDVSQNYDNIIKVIAAKMGSKYGTPNKKAA